jgi:hypothetical protein
MQSDGSCGSRRTERVSGVRGPKKLWVPSRFADHTPEGGGPRQRLLPVVPSQSPRGMTSDHPAVPAAKNKTLASDNKLCLSGATM